MVNVLVLQVHQLTIGFGLWSKNKNPPPPSLNYFWNFLLTLESHLIIVTKLEAVRYGLILAWNLGFKFSNLQTDSTLVILWLTKVGVYESGNASVYESGNARNTKFSITLYYNSTCVKLCLIRVRLHMTYYHIFTNYNSPHNKLRYKIISNYVLLALL